MIEAIDKHGMTGGSILAAKRLCRCHPWSEGCYDPVPEHFSFISKRFKK